MRPNFFYCDFPERLLKDCKKFSLHEASVRIGRVILKEQTIPCSFKEQRVISCSLYMPVLVRILQRNGTNCVYIFMYMYMYMHMICIFILTYNEELAHTIMEG